MIDQFLFETEPEESEQMVEHLGRTFPVYIDFGVTGMERLTREVRSALHRPQTRRNRRPPPAAPSSNKYGAKCARL